MAIDPAAAATGEWGLTPIGSASQSTTPLAPQPMLTPAQIAMMRQHAASLQEPPKGGIHHWTQGLAELMRTIQGNREADFARNAETSGRQQGADAISKMYAPYLSGGASPNTGSGAAPASSTAPASDSGNSGGGATVTADAAPAAADSSAPAADSSAPRGIRNNNPLNIEDGQFARSQPGYAGSDGRFAKFEAPEHGVAAASTLLDSYQKNHGLNTVTGIVNRWAPASDNNDTKSYASHVASQMGIGPNDPIPPEMRPQLIAAMARHENGVPLPAAGGRAPTGLLAPIPPPAAPAARMSLAPDAAPATALPPEITQGASLPPVPPVTPASVNAPMINAIAGRPAMPTGAMPPGGVPWNPDDFKRQVAAMEAAKAPVAAPVGPIAGGAPGPTPVGADTPPLTPTEQSMMAMVPAGGGPIGGPGGGGSPGGGSPPLTPTEQQLLAMVGGGAPAPASPDVASGPVGPMPSGPTTPTEQQMMELVNRPLTPTEQQMMAMVGKGADQNGPLTPTEKALMALVKPGAIPSSAPPEATPPIAGPVPIPVPRPPMALPDGSAIPGAIGATSVGGSPLVPPTLPPPVGATSTNGQPLPTAGGIPPATLVSAIAGGAPVAGPAAGGGAPIPPPPVQVAQRGAPAGGAPAGAGGAPGLPQPLTSPVGQINPQQLTQMLANPWVPDSAKAAMLQMIQQRAQPQSMPVEGGTMMFDAAGRKVFIPEPKFGTVKIGGAEIPTVSHFDPSTKQWNTTTLAPGGGVQTTGATPSGTGGDMSHPAAPQSGSSQPDLSSIGGIQAAEAAQAGAKKAAEAGGEATAKYYDSLHKGLAGSAMIAAQQKQNIDMLRQVAATPNFTPGAGSDAALSLQRLAAQFGINPEGAAPREIFNQVATRILADQISGLKSMASETGETGGRIFKSMLDLEEKANITPEDTAAGIDAKLNLIDHAGNLMMKWGDMADDYVAKNGKLDPGFDKTLRGEISKARIPDVVPKAATAAPSDAHAAWETEMKKRGLLNQPAAPVSQ